MWELCLFPTPCACYLRRVRVRVLLTGSDSELEESWSVSSMSCWLVKVGMLTRAWWRSLALPNLRLSYNTARRRTTNTERAMPVKGSCVAETWPGKQCPLQAASLGMWHRWQNSNIHPFPLDPFHLPLTSSLSPHPALSWQGWPTRGKKLWRRMRQREESFCTNESKNSGFIRNSFDV